MTFGAFGVYSGRKMSVDEALPSLHLNKRLGSRLGMHRHSKCGEGWVVDRRGECWPTQEVPPRRRALVLVDAVSGEVVEHLVEDNVEEAGEDA